MQPTLATAFYAPSEPPTSLDHLRYYIKDELLKVSSVLQLLASGHVDKTFVAPTKPRDGDIRYADGTSWNPGSGAGVYYFNGSIWKLLG